jgi:hypothetical protein
MPGKWSTTELHPQQLYCLSISHPNPCYCPLYHPYSPEPWVASQGTIYQVLLVVEGRVKGERQAGDLLSVRKQPRGTESQQSLE